MSSRLVLPRVHVLRIPLGLTLIMALLSCSETGMDPEPPCPTCATELVEAANDSLEVILYGEINGPDPERPADVRFDAAHQLYAEALDKDPDNLTAHFGFGLTSLLILSSDPEVNAAYDEWKAYLDENNPFEIESGSGSPLGIPVGLHEGSSAIRMPFTYVMLSMLGPVIHPLGVTVHPQISRIQSILHDRVIPKARMAVQHLEVVSADPNFTFEITPRMQGDEDAEPREVDQTDILLMETGCALLSAACRIASAYELSFAAYDSASLHQAIQPGSNWLKLRPGGRGDLGTAKTEILEATQYLKRGLNALLAEESNQDNDLIKVARSDRDDVDSILVHLPDVRQALNTSYTHVEDWDGRTSTPEVGLRISAGAFFSDPIEDLKTLLPGYSGRVQRNAADLEYRFDQGSADISVEIPTTGFYSSGYSLYVSRENLEVIEDFSGSSVFETPMTQLALGRFAAARDLPNWSGIYQFNAYFDGNLEQGIRTASVIWYENYTLAGFYVAVPVITWSANTFEEWLLPDPTLHGILPDIQSTQELWTLFGLDDSDWEKELVIDWTEDFD